MSIPGPEVLLLVDALLVMVAQSTSRRKAWMLIILSPGFACALLALFAAKASRPVSAREMPARL